MEVLHISIFKSFIITSILKHLRIRAHQLNYLNSSMTVLILTTHVATTDFQKTCFQRLAITGLYNLAT